MLNIDGDEIIKMSHGRRSIDVLKLYAPDKANQKGIYTLFPFLPILNTYTLAERPT